MQHPVDFYLSIPPIDSINDIIDPQHYYPAPADWYVALSDIRGSTAAIAAGRYKEVNAVAAASITALLNQVPEFDLPFVFGGDGASILVPPDILPQARAALLATRRLARVAFGLELRVGLVPVRDVLADGYQIRVGRLHMSENFQQAIFTGGGLAHAESLLKRPPPGRDYILYDDDSDYEADYSGFECRWNRISSPHDEIVSLMVMAVDEHESHAAIYGEVLREIDHIYGDSSRRHPLTLHNLNLALLPGAFSTEARIRHGRASLAHLLRIARGTLLGRIAMRFNIRGWGRYKGLLIGSTDHEKFDDTLRMTISGRAAQRAALRNWLELQRQQGRLVYGIHAGRHALITCIIHDHFGKQVHFVDGADGGYARAALELKGQLAALPAPLPQGSGR